MAEAETQTDRMATPLKMLSSLTDGVCAGQRELQDLGYLGWDFALGQTVKVRTEMRGPIRKQ